LKLRRKRKKKKKEKKKDHDTTTRFESRIVIVWDRRIVWWRTI